MAMRVRAFITHPIQYFSPMFRAMAQYPDIDLHVFYFSDHSVRGGVDHGFGRSVAWDVPLLDGYSNSFISRNVEIDQPDLVVIPDLDQVVAKASTDVVYIHGYFRAFEKQLLEACPRLGIPLVMRGDFDLRRHVDDDGRRSSWLRSVAKQLILRRKLKRVSAFGVVGQNARDFLIKCGVDRSKVFSAPYAIDDQALLSQSRQLDPVACRRQLGISDGMTVFLFSGKFVVRKRVDLLIEGFKRANLPNAHLVLVGDGPLRETICRQAESSCGTRWTAAGFVNQSEMPRYLLAADFLVLPSAFETWGLVVNEAMWCGLPCICSDQVGSVADLVSHNQTGWVFENGNADALAAQLRTAAAQTGQQRTRMQQAVRERISGYSVANAAAGIRKALLFAAKLCPPDALRS